MCHSCPSLCVLAGPMDVGALSARLLWGTEIPRQRICSSEWVGQGQVWAWPVLEESKSGDKEKGRGAPGEPTIL